MKTKVYIALLLVVTLLLSLGFTQLIVKGQKKIATEEDFTIVTSFYPMYIATCNIVGDTEGVSVVNMSEPQSGCLHDFQMTPDDMRLLSMANVFVANGGGIESFLGDVEKQYTNLKVITATSGMMLLSEEAMESGIEAGTRDNGSQEAKSKHGKDADGNGKVEEGEGGDDEANAHAWTSVARYKEMVNNILEGLIEADPDHAEAYRENADAYMAKLDEVEMQQLYLTMLYAGQNVILFHEAFAYVADDLGMNVVYTLDLDEEREISAAEIAETITAIRKSHVKIIFAEEKYAAKVGKIIEQECDVQILYLNPLTKKNDRIEDNGQEMDFYLYEQYNNYAQILNAYGSITP